MRRHPEEGLRFLQRPARHQRRHRLPGRAGGEEGHRPPDRPAARRRDSPTGYGPSDLQSAYCLTSAASASGSGRTITIAYDDPTAESDLTNTHDSQALMPLSGASRRSAPPASPTEAGRPNSTGQGL